MVKRKCVFLDRDGVINVPIFKDGRSFAPILFDDFEIYPSAYDACQMLKKAGYLIVVITNQPDVGNGKASKSEIERMNQYLKSEELVDDIFICYHSQDEQCVCRKPKAGMIFQALEKYSIDLGASFLVGDRKSDIEVAVSVNCKSIFIDHDYDEVKPVAQNITLKSLKEAAEYILRF